jgi:hypothetical protein
MKVRSRLVVRSVFIGVVAVGGAAGVVSACSRESLAKPFDGESLGYCSGPQVHEIHPASDCQGCTGNTAYALCNGSSYDECSCGIPEDYSLDGGEIDSGQGPPTVGVISFGGGGPQGVSLPCCEGNEVFEIPAAECGNCSATETPTVAYAVCQGGGYSGCSCEIPDGYSYPDGPGPCDGN